MNNAGPDLIAFLETRRCQGSCKHTHTHKHKHTHRSHKCCGVLVGWSPAKSLPTPQRKADVQLVSTGAQHSPLLLWHCCLLVLPVSSSENTPNHPSIFLCAFPIREGGTRVLLFLPLSSSLCSTPSFSSFFFHFSFLLLAVQVTRHKVHFKPVKSTARASNRQHKHQYTPPHGHKRERKKHTHTKAQDDGESITESKE